MSVLQFYHSRIWPFTSHLWLLHQHLLNVDFSTITLLSTTKSTSYFPCNSVKTVSTQQVVAEASVQLLHPLKESPLCLKQSFKEVAAPQGPSRISQWTKTLIALTDCRRIERFNPGLEPLGIPLNHPKRPLKAKAPLAFWPLGPFHMRPAHKKSIDMVLNGVL